MEDFLQSTFDERLSAIKGLGRDVRVRAGQANTQHECVAAAAPVDKPPNFHRRTTKKHQI